MHTWNQIEATFKRYTYEPSLADYANTMLQAVQIISTHDTLTFLNRSVGLETESPLETLLLWRPGERQMLHVECTRPGVIELYVVEPGTFQMHAKEGMIECDLGSLADSIYHMFRQVMTNS